MIAAVSADDKPGVRFVTLQEPFQGAVSAEWHRKGVRPSNDGHRAPSEALIAAIEGPDAALGQPDLWPLVIVPVAFAAVRPADFVVRGWR